MTESMRNHVKKKDETVKGGSFAIRAAAVALCSVARWFGGSRRCSVPAALGPKVLIALIPLRR
ncbi:hypothetical protein F2Q70_00014528 [Brassica cretica]|uniref:Uncharacterized protein n=1 Tax=Brassica cretica TaxID=69181 RepID=A0A8S9I234_BRACR|nr:hypothetical protein F2Q70_00014528 [Brassica cretica]